MVAAAGGRFLKGKSVKVSAFSTVLWRRFLAHIVPISFEEQSGQAVSSKRMATIWGSFCLSS